MSRVQLALNVDDLDRAVVFYSKMFGVEPAKVRPGYANFVVEEPALKLVLLQNQGRGGTLNHLGVEVATTAEVDGARRRLSDAGLAPTEQNEAACCYALQEKVWVHAPDGEPWEIYTVLGHTEEPPACSPAAAELAGSCC